MQNRTPDLITKALEGWRPSAEAQQLIFWRLLQLMMARYGSVPLGQCLVGMTNTIVNEMGRAPTVTELCEATGLPKSSISRYISAQMEQGVVPKILTRATAAAACCGRRTRARPNVTGKFAKSARFSTKSAPGISARRAGLSTRKLSCSE